MFKNIFDFCVIMNKSIKKSTASFCRMGTSAYVYMYMGQQLTASHKSLGSLHTPFPPHASKTTVKFWVKHYH